MRCPNGRDGAFSFQEKNASDEHPSIRCERCGENYPVIDGVYHFAFSAEFMGEIPADRRFRRAFFEALQGK